MSDVGPAGPEDYLVICDATGQKLWRSQCRLQAWNNMLVRADLWEPRQPQDLIRSRPDRQTVPIARPEPADAFQTEYQWDESSKTWVVV